MLQQLSKPPMTTHKKIKHTAHTEGGVHKGKLREMCSIL